MPSALDDALRALVAHLGSEPTTTWLDEEQDASAEVPHVGCAWFSAADAERPFGTLTTVGMSSKRMVLDERAVDSDTARAELVAYVDGDAPPASLVRWMRFAGQFPFLQEPPTFLGWGHTVRMGDLFPGSKLTTLLTLTSIVRPDQGVVFDIDGDPVSLLWLVFLTDAEYALKKRDGVNAILDLFEERDHPLTFTSSRESYV